MGVVGFVRHLSRGHGIKPDRPNQRLEWVIDRCHYRNVPDEDITALTEDLPGVIGPKKVPFRQTVAIGASKKAEHRLSSSIKRRPSKRVTASDSIDYNEDDDDSEVEVDGGDGDGDAIAGGGGESDFSPIDGRRSLPESTKKRRHSLANAGSKQNSRPSKKHTKTSAPVTPNGTPPNGYVEEGTSISTYCPCSIAGHACRDSNCTKIRVCTVSLKATLEVATLLTSCPENYAR
jgi:hypothetical protein